jgi:hypothetical protein
MSICFVESNQNADFYSSNLEDDNVKKEYERGYKTLLDFFHKYF